VRLLVCGGAGFLGSHFCSRLLDDGHQVVCFDSLLTGNFANISNLTSNDRFSFEEVDVTRHINLDGDIDWVVNLASPASPVDYLEHPIHTLKVGALGTLNGLGLAKHKGAGFFLASTSEVYGDPLEHPQKESYRGNVDPIGPRGVYDEAKRYAEAMVYAYHRTHGIRVRVARIFNTYGPKMRRHDGRAIPTFIGQALKGEPLTVHGDGTQTRSLCYVDDLIEGFSRMLSVDDVVAPVNLGNPYEIAVLDLAKIIVDEVGSDSEIVFTDRPVDDPEVRCPDISRAKELLGWAPEVALEDGLSMTIEWCRKAWT
jgi:dTDP-glucose 4,6-dehydratase